MSRAKALAYLAQSGMRAVDASVLMVSYGDVHVLELCLEGVPLRQANTAGYRLLHETLAPLTGSPPGQPPVAATVRCVGHRAEEHVGILDRALGQDQQPAQEPTTRIHHDHLAALLWQTETVRRHELGTPLLLAARGAYDAHLGKPRQKRAPVEAAWLAAQIDQTLTAAWWSLLGARLGGAYWLLDDRLAAACLDDDHRPVWQLDGARR